MSKAKHIFTDTEASDERQRQIYEIDELLEKYQRLIGFMNLQYGVLKKWRDMLDDFTDIERSFHLEPDTTTASAAHAAETQSGTGDTGGTAV